MQSRPKENPADNAEERQIERVQGASPVRYQQFTRGDWMLVDGLIIEESLITIYVNGQELVTMMATPLHLEALAVGFLVTEGVIAHAADIRQVTLAPNRSCVDVWLRQKGAKLPQRKVLTSGCGRGTSLERISPDIRPLESSLSLEPLQLAGLMKQMLAAAEIYHQARGVHAAGLATPDQVVLVEEDVGRHNALDKLFGCFLLDGLDPADHILLSSGRLSSEMVGKAHKMGVPIVASLSSPTSLSLQRADAWGITVVGYLRGDRMRIYTHPQRLRGR